MDWRDFSQPPYYLDALSRDISGHIGCSILLNQGKSLKRKNSLNIEPNRCEIKLNITSLSLKKMIFKNTCHTLPDQRIRERTVNQYHTLANGNVLNRKHLS